MNIGRFHMNGKKTYTPKNMNLDDFLDHPLPQSQRDAINKKLEELDKNHFSSNRKYNKQHQKDQKEQQE